MKEKGITSYRLFKMGFPQSNYYAMKHGENVSTNTINELCILLECKISDVMEFLPENRRQILAGSSFFMQNVQKDKNMPSRDKKPRRKLIDFRAYLKT